MNDLKVKVNPELCERIGKELKKFRFRPSFIQRAYLRFDSDKETKLRTYLFSLAICHQTHTLVNRKWNLVGWDYLEDVFLDLAKSKSPLLDPSYVATLSTAELCGKLGPLFSEDGNPLNCTLDRLEERANLLISLSKGLNDSCDGKLKVLVERCGGFLIKNGNGLYEMLGRFEAYSDPSKKKSTCFVKFASEAGLLPIRDPENAVPIMDYHMQRVLLRTGCVEVTDRKLKGKLIHRETLDSDELVRDTCIKAMKLIAEFSGRWAPKMNDFFYPLGRSCCQEKMLCRDKECSKNPCTLDIVVELPSHSSCILEGVCKGSNDESYRRFWQPLVETHFY